MKRNDQKCRIYCHGPLLIQQWKIAGPVFSKLYMKLPDFEVQQPKDKDWQCQRFDDSKNQHEDESWYGPAGNLDKKCELQIDVGCWFNF